ncbi:unnamed protein product, partial [Nesidiocoris tenuis]
MLKSLSSDVFDSRAARLYTLVTRSFGSTHLLNIACGYPISQSDVSRNSVEENTWKNSKNSNSTGIFSGERLQLPGWQVVPLFVQASLAREHRRTALRNQ